MPLRITKERTQRGLKSAVEDSSGVDLDVCLQCRRCSNGCPVSSYTQSSPSEIIKLLQMEAGKEILDLEIIWTCASCGTCFSRCPMKIDMSAVMDALRMIAEKTKATPPAGNMPLMNRLLLRTMKYFGRTYDLGALMLYKAGTATYLKDAGKFPAMLKKGKIALLPPRGADAKMVKRIFNITGARKEKRK
jgi:heterodisulfide reductase subunit C2